METGTSKVAIDSQIFRCDNLSLAIALSAMGCKFAQSDGRTLAGLNQYTLAFIRGQLDPKTGEPRAKGLPRPLGLGGLRACIHQNQIQTKIAILSSGKPCQ